MIWRRIPAIKEAMTNLFQTKQEEIFALISLYQKAGKIRAEVTTKQIKFLAEQFIFNIQSWLIVKNYSSDGGSSEYYAKLLFRLWLPYLHESEISTWEGLLD